MLPIGWCGSLLTRLQVVGDPQLWTPRKGMSTLKGPLAGGRWCPFELWCSLLAGSGRSLVGALQESRGSGLASSPFCPLPCLQDPFVAFHINKGLVRKHMNSLLIGELSPEQPSFEPTKNVRPCLVLGDPMVVEGQGVEGRPRQDHR